MPVLDRYIVRELISPFCFGGALFTFFLVIDRIYHLTDLVITKGVPFHLVIQLLVFMLPSFLAHTLPMAFLVAVLLAGGRLAGDLEIIAFKAAGISSLSGRLIHRALDLLGYVDFSPPALRADLAGPRENPGYLYSASELLDRAADLASESATLVHENERRWRIFGERVHLLTEQAGASGEAGR